MVAGVLTCIPSTAGLTESRLHFNPTMQVYISPITTQAHTSLRGSCGGWLSSGSRNEMTYYILTAPIVILFLFFLHKRGLMCHI